MGPRQRGRRNKKRCPECLAPIYLKDVVKLWEPITCPECHAALEVVELNPLRIDYMMIDDDEDDETDED